jgi:hypothetical protein
MFRRLTPAVNLVKSAGDLETGSSLRQCWAVLTNCYESRIGLPSRHHCTCFVIRKDVRLYSARHEEMATGQSIALVCLARLDSTKIEVYTPYRKAKELLQARLRPSKQGSRHFAESGRLI